MMTNREEIGLNISDALKARGMTQTELANLSGISTTSISRYIHGGSYPTMDRLVIIAEILGTNIFELLKERNK